MKPLQLFLKAGLHEPLGMSRIRMLVPALDHLLDEILNVGFPCGECHDQAGTLENLGVLRWGFGLIVEMLKQILRIPDGHIKPFTRLRHAGFLYHPRRCGKSGRWQKASVV